MHYITLITSKEEFLLLGTWPEKSTYFDCLGQFGTTKGSLTQQEFCLLKMPSIKNNLSNLYTSSEFEKVYHTLQLYRGLPQPQERKCIVPYVVE